MTDETHLFKSKYLIPEIRLPYKDYGEPGSYFVTICAKGRVPWFGRIQHGRMCLSDIGRIIHNAWMTIPMHYPHIALDAFVVMPDHVHGIIRIRSRNETHMNVEACHGTPRTKTTNNVSIATMHSEHAIMTKNEACHGTPLQDERRPFRLQSQSLGSMINQFKSTCTRELRKKGFEGCLWQRRFYERIIRNKTELNRIRQYIKENPIHWQKEIDDPIFID
jgi:REP element-mobilizing transposase RayT